MNELTEGQKSMPPRNKQTRRARAVDELLYGVESIRADLVGLEALAHAAANSLEHVPYYARSGAVQARAEHRESAPARARWVQAGDASADDQIAADQVAAEPVVVEMATAEMALAEMAAAEMAAAMAADVQRDSAAADAHAQALVGEHAEEAAVGERDSALGGGQDGVRMRTEAEVRLHMDRLQTLVYKTAQAALSLLITTSALLEECKAARPRRPGGESSACDKFMVFGQRGDVMGWERHLPNLPRLLKSFERN